MTTLLDKAREDWQNAPRGAKTAIVRRWATTLGISYAQLYRKLDVGRKRRKGDRQIPDIEKYVEIVCRIKKKPPEKHGEISTDQALILAVENGHVPPELIDKVSTFDRVARDLGMTKRKRRVVRFQAEYANQLHHVDASTSQFFFIHRELDDGDFVLRLHDGSKRYKNKPVPIRLRPWLYGLTDDYSGYHVARYVAALGESALDNLDFLSWAWGRTDGSKFFGLPDKIKGDLGPMMRGEEAKDFFSRLGVEIDPSTPGNSAPHGKIERPWRTSWQRFEKTFFAQTDWKKYEITMSELNRRFLIYQEEDLNRRKHRYERHLTRVQIWEISVNQRGGVVEMPENAAETIVKRLRRHVNQDGCISVDNKLYEIKGLHDAWVWVYFGVFEDKIVVEDCKTGQKYDVVDFSPLALGEFKTPKDSIHQKTIKAAQELTLVNTLHTEREETTTTKIPTRTRETRTVANPLNTDAFPDIETAIIEFRKLYGRRIDPDLTEALKSLITENGLSKRFVTDLALQSQGERDVGT